MTVSVTNFLQLNIFIGLELRVHHGYIDDYVAYKEHLYKKIAMLDCHTCINFNKECEPYNNVFKCNYPLKTSSKELKNN